MAEGDVMEAVLERDDAGPEIVTLEPDEVRASTIHRHGQHWQAKRQDAEGRWVYRAD
jgi:hypothetical protein